MTEPQKISLYRVKQAYDLNEHEAQALLNALSPHGIFPCAVWHEAYSLFWEKPAAECTVQCGAENPPFPEYAPASTPLFPVDSYATLMTDFFFEMARRVPVKELEKASIISSKQATTINLICLTMKENIFFTVSFRRKEE